MKERLAAIAASAGILVTGCSIEGGNPTPQNIGELVTAHEAPFLEGSPRVTKTTQLEVGSRAIGICLLYVSSESATIISGMIRVQRGDTIGTIPTISREGDEFVDTFKDKTEEDLASTYPRCDDLDKAEQEREQQASLL